MRQWAQRWHSLLLAILLLGATEAREFHLNPLLGKGNEKTPTLERVPSKNHTIVHHTAADSGQEETVHQETDSKGDLTDGRPANRSNAGHSLGAGAGKRRTAPQTRSRKLDIVIAHYDLERINAMKEFWLWFFGLEVVKAWKPYIFVYTQSEANNVVDELQPFIQQGGEIVRLDNAGRESHVYLQHIIRKYRDLANHTLFTQDAPNTELLPKKFEKLFVNKTGFLPLSFMGHVDCFEHWNGVIPPKVIPQLYGMFTHNMCPTTGYAAGFEGQFIVSKQRILERPLTMYQHLRDMVAAPADHWVHEYHSFEPLKLSSNPYMGHALERAWSLAFNCFEVWRQANCYDCEFNKQHENCGTDACVCFDIDRD